MPLTSSDGSASDGENGGATPTGDTVEVRDDREQSRFEAWFHGELAGIAYYELRSGELTFTHTEVQPQFEGHGIGGALAHDALAAARASGLPVVPLCPFIADYIEKHTEFLDLVPGPVQKRLGL
jgi:predicted GNAT family acetyltransferase